MNRQPRIPEGIKAKALGLGYSIEVKRGGMVSHVIYRFSNRTESVSGWMDVGRAHAWLDQQISNSKGDRT